MNQIKGKEFVFTGRISITRHEAWLLVEKCGGSVGTSITYGTDYAVVGDAAGVKAQKAKERGVTVLDENTFFEWINEALLEIPTIVTEPIPLPEPELPVDDTPIDIKEWVKGATCFQCENCGNSFAVHLKEGELPRCPICVNEEDSALFSWNNPDVLERIKRDNPELKLAPEMNCPGCRVLIPYSIHTKPLIYYCFHCRYYYTWREDMPEYTDKHGIVSGGEACWHVGLVKDVADLYTLTRKLLYGGFDWQPYREQPPASGDPSLPTVCLINEVGRSLTMSTEEVRKTEELDRLRDSGNSAEHAVDMLRDTQKRAASSVAIEAVQKLRVRTLTPAEAPEDYERYVQSRLRKEQRHEKKAQERFEKRQARRLSSFTPAPSSPETSSAPSAGEKESSPFNFNQGPL